VENQREKTTKLINKILNDRDTPPQRVSRLVDSSIRAWSAAPAQRTRLRRLRALDVLGFGSLVTGDNIEENLIALIQRFKALPDNGRMMNEHILAGLLGYETEPFFVVPPFYFTTGHSFLLSFRDRS